MFCRRRQPIICFVNLNSKYFDSIRIAPRKRRGVEEPPHVRRMKREQPPKQCEWGDCREAGKHRAPRSSAGPNHPLDGSSDDDDAMDVLEEFAAESGDQAGGGAVSNPMDGSSGVVVDFASDEDDEDFASDSDDDEPMD